MGPDLMQYMMNGLKRCPDLDDTKGSGPKITPLVSVSTTPNVWFLSMFA
jgi:hypothetical protein